MEDDDDVLSFVGIQNLKTKNAVPSSPKKPKPQKVDQDVKSTTKPRPAAAVTKKTSHKSPSIYAPKTTILFSDDDDFLSGELSTDKQEKQKTTSKTSQKSQSSINTKTNTTQEKKRQQKEASTKKEEEGSTRTKSSNPTQKKRSRKDDTTSSKPPSKPTKKPKLSQQPHVVIDDEDDDNVPLQVTTTKKSVSKFTNFQWDKDSPKKKKRPTKRIRTDNGTSETEKERASKSTGNVSELWIDKYPPTDEKDLALFHKRISDVKAWLLQALHPGRPMVPRLLCLTGPSGSGKTALIRVLAAHLDCEVAEWTNPVHSSWQTAAPNGLPYTSAMEVFKQFMYSSRRYPSLVPTGLPQNKIILLEDLPFLDQEPQRKEFGNILEQAVHSSQFPVVLILSDTSLANSPLWKILPPSLLHDKRVTQIKCGSIAPSKMKKALKAICQKENISPSGHTIDSVIEQSGGDIRHAINSLQFLCTNPNGTLTSKKKSLFKVPAKKSKTSSVSSNTTAIGSRDVSLSIFHALGKVLYNKRLAEENVHGDSIHEDFVSQVTENNAEEVLEQSFADEGIFLSFLHENYPSFLSDIEPAVLSTSYLSDADILSSDWANRSTMKGYAGSVGVRGYQWGHQGYPPTEGKMSFMPLYKPKMLATQSELKENSHALREFWVSDSYRFKAPSSTIPLSVSLPNHVLSQELLPYIHKITTAIPPSSAAPRRPRTFHPLANVFSTGQKELIMKLCKYGKDGKGREMLDQEERVAVPPSPDAEEQETASPTPPAASSSPTTQNEQPNNEANGALNNSTTTTTEDPSSPTPSPSSSQTTGGILPDDDIDEF